MKSVICILLSFLALTVSFDADAQLPPEMKSKYSDEEYKAIMGRYHFHFRYELYGPVDKPVKRGQVKLGHEYYDRWQGPSGWYYCSADGECFDNRGLGVDAAGSCWVDKNHQCTSDAGRRDISMFAQYFRVRGDLGPAMTLTGEIPKKSSTAGSQLVAEGETSHYLSLSSLVDLLGMVSPVACLGFIGY